MKPSSTPSKADFDVLVLGAGVVGINTAYWNLRNGKSVCDRTVIDADKVVEIEPAFAERRADIARCRPTPRTTKVATR